QREAGGPGAGSRAGYGGALGGAIGPNPYRGSTIRRAPEKVEPDSAVWMRDSCSCSSSSSLTCTYHVYVHVYEDEDEHDPHGPGSANCVSRRAPSGVRA